mgnify:CR=1 FL=1
MDYLSKQITITNCIFHWVLCMLLIWLRQGYQKIDLKHLFELFSWLPFRDKCLFQSNTSYIQPIHQSVFSQTKKKTKRKKKILISRGKQIAHTCNKVQKTWPLRWWASKFSLCSMQHDFNSSFRQYLFINNFSSVYADSIMKKFNTK